MTAPNDLWLCTYTIKNARGETVKKWTTMRAGSAKEAQVEFGKIYNPFSLMRIDRIQRKE